jgi:hypothetical protein
VGKHERNQEACEKRRGDRRRVAGRVRLEQQILRDEVQERRDAEAEDRRKVAGDAPTLA